MISRTLSALCIIGAASALQLQASTELEADKFNGLNNTSSWSMTTDKGNFIRANTSGKWTDPDFTATQENRGNVGGDSANIANGAQSSPVQWARLSDMFGADTVLFAPKDKTLFSSVQQGTIGDCYMIATMIQFDSRPGAIEDLFVTKTTNDQAAYTMKFYIAGEPVYVTVDDYVPVTKVWAKDKNGAWISTKQLRPVYASSMHYGEIWPMLYEKAWAKLVGSYHAIEYGTSRWTLQHMTNDPYKFIGLRGQGFTEWNDTGLELWKNLMKWTTKEYLMFTETDNASYIKGHAFTLLKVAEITMNGVPVKMVQLRNPWKGNDGWKGDYSETKGGAKWAALVAGLKAHGGIKKEAGKFWMAYYDFVKEYSGFTLAYSQESRTEGGLERVEYRPLVKLSRADVEYVRLTLFEDADLDNYFQLDLYQGGNRVGTDRNKSFTKWNTVYNKYVMVSSAEKYDSSQLNFHKWGGWGTEKNYWDVNAQSGSFHVFDKKTTKFSKIPKGEYIIRLTADWKEKTPQNPIVKDRNLLIAAPTKISVDKLTHEQAIRVASKGKAAYKNRGYCSLYTNRQMPAGKSLAEYAELTKAAGFKQFSYALGQPQWGAYMCSDGDTPSRNGWSDLMDTYDVLETAQPVAPAVEPETPTSISSYIPPAVTTPTVTPTAVVAPTVTTPVVPSTTCNMLFNSASVQAVLRKEIEKKAFVPYGTYAYRAIGWYKFGGADGCKFFAEEFKNTSSTAKTYKITFNSKMKALTQTQYTIQPNERYLNTAVYKDSTTPFSWSLYNLVVQ